MGRSYWFECSRCGYRAKVSGRLDRGVDFFVRTILCRNCKALYDAVTRVRWSEAVAQSISPHQLGLDTQPLNRRRAPRISPPSFEAALSRLRTTAAARLKWINFPLQCPISSNHRVEEWNDPHKCPRCGAYMEKSALPYRIWD